MRKNFPVTVAAVLVGLLTSSGFAQQVPTDPTSTHIFPAGGRRGTSVSVRVGGECVSPYSRFLIDGSGVSAEPELVEKVTANYEPSPRRKPGETPMNYPREWKSTITIATDAPTGQVLWRTSSARGGTSARPFLIGDLPEFIETESNSTPETAERIALPVTVNGQIAGERDLDYYRFAARKGEVITIEVAVARIGSTLEPVVEIYDVQLRRVPVEQIRVGSDPVIAVRIPTDGDYRILISNLKFRGGPQYVYRLTISTAPFVKYAFPPGAVAGSISKVQFFALSGDGSDRSWTETVAFPESAGEFDFASSTSLANRVVLESTALPAMVEAEPNNDSGTATSVTVGSAVYGQFSSPADVDWYACKLDKDQAITLECCPFPVGSGLLPALAIIGADGTRLAAANAAERLPRTCRLEWRAPQVGTYFINVRDVRLDRNESGAPPYRLTIRPTKLDFAVTASIDTANVVQGLAEKLN